jgi:hypothetical protein
MILAALLFAGCTRAVEMPLEKLDSEAQSHEAHLITMKDDTRYAIDRFSTTDSTIVIVKLNLADERYKHVDLPIVVNREDVKSLQKLELDQGKSFFLVAPLGLAVLFIILLATSPPILSS